MPTVEVTLKNGEILKYDKVSIVAVALKHFGEFDKLEVINAFDRRFNRTERDKSRGCEGS